tara:strand:+ start:192 stop:452 length:261 start_codon:yes stop_codon:yes gene_type:complete
MTRKDYQYFANILGVFEYYLETNQDIKNEFSNLKDNIRLYFIKDNRRFDYDRFDKAMNKSFFDTKKEDDSRNTYASTYTSTEIEDI